MIQNVFWSKKNEEIIRYKNMNFEQFFYRDDHWHEISVCDNNHRIDLQLISPKNVLKTFIKISNTQSVLFGSRDAIDQAYLHKNRLYLSVCILGDDDDQEGFRAALVIKAKLPGCLLDLGVQRKALKFKDLKILTKRFEFNQWTRYHEMHSSGELKIFCNEFDERAGIKHSTLRVLNDELEPLVGVELGFTGLALGAELLNSNKIYFYTSSKPSKVDNEGNGYPVHNYDSFVINTDTLKVTSLLSHDSEPLSYEVVCCLEDGFIGIQAKLFEEEGDLFELIGLVPSIGNL